MITFFETEMLKKSNQARLDLPRKGRLERRPFYEGKSSVYIQPGFGQQILLLTFAGLVRQSRHSGACARALGHVVRCCNLLLFFGLYRMVDAAVELPIEAVLDRIRECLSDVQVNSALVIGERDLRSGHGSGRES
jgi:hypothetical protein